MPHSVPSVLTPSPQHLFPTHQTPMHPSIPIQRLPSPLGSHSLVSPLQWCLAGCHPVPHLTPSSIPACQGRGAAGVAPICQPIPTPGLTFNHQEEKVMTPMRLWVSFLLPTATGCSVPVLGKGRDACRSHTLPTPRVQSLP